MKNIANAKLYIILSVIGVVLFTTISLAVLHFVHKPNESLQTNTNKEDVDSLKTAAFEHLKNARYQEALAAFKAASDQYKQSGQADSAEAADIENQIINVKAQIKSEEMKMKIESQPLVSDDEATVTE